MVELSGPAAAVLLGLPMLLAAFFLPGLGLGSRFIIGVIGVGMVFLGSRGGS